MGSGVEINDTLQITTEQGFPSKQMNRAEHVRNPLTTEMFSGKIFTFQGKLGARIFQLSPVRVYLVHNVEGKWLFWGKIAVIEQSITQVHEGARAGEWETGGKYSILEIYDPVYQELFTRRESPKGRSYFE